MNLDELLKALAAAAVPDPDAPLITTGAFVPPDSDDFEADCEASRRVVAAFAYWLIRNEKLAPSIPEERAAALAKIASAPEECGGALLQLGDRLLSSDVETAWRGFTREYVAPVEGGLGDDYFKLFVEARKRRTLRETLPSRADYEQLSVLIEYRARRFQRGSSNWREPAVAAGMAAPSLWTGGSKDEWLRRIRTYADLADSLPGHSRTRVEEFRSLVDAASTMPDHDVAGALARTYLWVRDASVQEAVFRALGRLPAAIVIQGILSSIVEIETKTSWAEIVVDVFRDDLRDADLLRLAEAVKASPLDARSAYVRAMTRAAKGGSVHAAALLAIYGR
jgi:hypothetical protein